MEMILSIIKTLAIIVISGSSFAFVYKVKDVISSMIEKIEDEKIANLLENALEIIYDCVNYVQQTIVDDLKESDTFTEEAQAEALATAKNEIMSLINEEMLEAIETTYGNAEEYIAVVIESCIAQNKILGE